MTEEQASPGLSSRLSTCVQPVADAWYRMLIDVNPGLWSDEVYVQIVAVTEALTAALEGDFLDAEAMRHIGAEMDTLDGLQPSDVQRIQVCILRAFSEVLPGDVRATQISHLAELLFGLAAGLYAGKSRRAARFDLEMTSRMGHDLKTPINAVTGFSRVILKGIDGPITDFQREDLTSIYEAGQRLLAMIDDLYAVKKQDAARSPVYDQPFQVSELLGDILRTIQPLAARRDHVFAVRALGELGMLDLDPSRVRWVLLCLLTQFIRGTSNGVMTLFADRDYPDGAWIVFTLEVRSDGGYSEREAVKPGIPSAAIAEDAPPLAGDDDLFICPTCQGVCEELGGALTWIESDDGALKITVRFPAPDAGSI